MEQTRKLSNTELTQSIIFDQGIKSVYGRKEPNGTGWTVKAVTYTGHECMAKGDTEDAALEQLLTTISIDKKANPDAYKEPDGGTTGVDESEEQPETSEQEISTTGAEAGTGDAGQEAGG